MKTIVLIGLPGSGKSTIAKNMGLNLEIVDIDSLVEKKENKTISEIFELYGEKYFREIEYQTIMGNVNPNSQIVALGGGAFENFKTREFLLKNSTVIYLKTSPEIIYQRIKNDIGRPLLKNNITIKKITELLNIREKNYKLAHFIVFTDNKSIKDIAEEISKCVRNCK